MLDTRRGGSFAEWSSGEGDGVVSVPVPARPASLRRRILYATPEMADFVKTGGLGEVSAALPRALVPHYDIRVLIPGYRQVRAAFPEIPVVARLEGFAGVPACDLGLVEAADGLRIYVLLSPDLYERDGTPYGDQHGDFGDNDNVKQHLWQQRQHQE